MQIKSKYEKEDINYFHLQLLVIERIFGLWYGKAKFVTNKYFANLNHYTERVIE